MSSYIHSKWLNSPVGSPVEFYSELDGTRMEVRKIEIFVDGRVGYATMSFATPDTRLGIEPIPSIAEIRQQSEFEINEISKDEFEAKWRALVAKAQ